MRIESIWKYKAYRKSVEKVYRNKKSVFRLNGARFLHLSDVLKLLLHC